MTEPTGFTDAMGEPDVDAREDDGVIDNDVVLGDEVDQELDRSWSPPERPLGLDAFGTTLAEGRQGETLDRRLAAEVPDPALAVEPADGGEGGAAGVGAFAGPAAPRSGRLVAPDEGLGPDEEKDLVAFDVGIDAGAASAEEAAMHVVDDENLAADEGSTI